MCDTNQDTSAVISDGIDGDDFSDSKVNDTATVVCGTDSVKLHDGATGPARHVVNGQVLNLTGVTATFSTTPENTGTT